MKIDWISTILCFALNIVIILLMAGAIIYSAHNITTSVGNIPGICFWAITAIFIVSKLPSFVKDSWIIYKEIQ